MRLSPKQQRSIVSQTPNQNQYRYNLCDPI